MPEPLDLGFAVRLPPKDAIAYFEAKGYRVSWNWWEVWQQAQAQSFTVAKATRADVLQAIRQRMQRALDEGITERQFLQTLEPALKTMGWWGKQIIVDPEGGAEVVRLGSPHRLKTIYRTNTQTAYNAGRYKQQLEAADRAPYWQYIAVMDARTRAAHAALHGKVFRFDDPIWQTHYPPNGFNCRCRVRTLSAAQLAREGLTVESSAGQLSERLVDVGLDKRTGEMVQAPVAVWSGLDRFGKPAVFETDPGWAYNPGAAAFGTDVSLMRKLSLIEDRAVRAQAVQALNHSALRQQVFADWVAAVLAAPRAQRRAGHAVQTLGLVDEDVADFVRAQGVEPARVAVLSEKALIHADRQAHADAGIALAPAEYQQLPEIIAHPLAVYWDTRHGNIVYVADAGRGLVIYVPVEMGWSLKKHGRLDAVANAYKIPAERLRDIQRYIRMERP
jgi:SPP1 gp7 family putative phage head morphogenesis protein